MLTINLLTIDLSLLPAGEEHTLPLAATKTSQPVKIAPQVGYSILSPTTPISVPFSPLYLSLSPSYSLIYIAVGKYSTTPGASSAAFCVACRAGTYAPTTGNDAPSACVGCEAGKFSTKVAANSSMVCTPCPQGTSRSRAAFTQTCVLPHGCQLPFY